MRYGVIGGGGMARAHAGHVVRLPGAVLAAVAAPDIHADLIALAHSVGATVGTDVDALISRTDIDAVIIATPTDTHAGLTIAALQAGKDVLVEKPIARTVAEGEAMAATAHRHGRKLLCGQVVRYFAEYATAHDLIVAGSIGTVGVARTSRAGAHPPATSWYADTSRSGGVALDLLIHDVDWLLWTFGPVARIYARGLTARQIPGRDGVLAILRFANGVIAHVEANWAYPGGFTTTLEVAGSDGIVAHTNTGVTDLRMHAQPGSPAQLAKDPAAREDPYYAQLCAFDTWIRGGAAPRSTPASSIESLRIALAIAASAADGTVYHAPLHTGAHA